MPEHELWLTKIFNDHLAGPANSILTLVRVEAENPQRPWANWLVMELLVVAILVVLLAALRSRMSVDNPGKIQHLFEIIYQFIKDTMDEIGIQHGARYVPYFATIFIFILAMNLIGIIPTFESPTMTVAVTFGLALSSIAFYHYNGVRELGVLSYLKQFVGPIWWLFFLMIPIEIMSHLARPLSLTVRLYANMFAGDQVTEAFIKLTKLVVPVIFMALHLFVAVLQAYIFTLLSMIYVNGATSHEH